MFIQSIKTKTGPGFLSGRILLLAGLMFFILFGQNIEARSETTAIDKSIPGSFSELFKNAKDSVVNISTVKVVKGGARLFRGGPLNPNDPFNDFFERYFKDQVPREFRQRSLGSGFIIDKEGFILTNNHVVEQTDEIKVKLANGKEYDAKIIGRDPKTDLALIQIKADESLKVLQFGDSDALDVGDWVVAIGNPFGLDHTVTAGIVSAKYRNIGAGSYDNFIQTDASINPGNSGGPLIDTGGKVVGINSAIFSQSGGSVGIGFAIPINMARDLLPQLKSGRVIRGWLGVMIQDLTPDLKDKLGIENEHGALVADVTLDGPADKAGILRGDVVITFDGKMIKDMKELPLIVANTPVNKVVTVEVIRKGKKLTLDVKIAELVEKQEEAEPAMEQADLGMIVEEITPQMSRQYNLPADSGLIISQVEEDSAAEEAGLRRGDIILEIDQTPLQTLNEYRDKISQYKKGDTILFLIKRQEATIYLTLKVAK